MNKNYFDKYVKYKSKYLNLTYDVKNISNQSGGANRYTEQFMITVMLSIKNSDIINNIINRYIKIKELINNVEEMQEPHFTLFQIMINGNNVQVKNKTNEFLMRQNNSTKKKENAIHYYMGNTIGDINKLVNKNEDFLKYQRGISTYTIFENEEKYFYCKEFEIIDEEKKQKINNDLIDKLKEVFLADNFPKKGMINNNDCTIYCDEVGDEIFYYNDFYQTQSTLHITIAKIKKMEWRKYDVFNMTNEDSKKYLLYVCNKIISNALFSSLLSNKSIIKSNDLQLKVSTQQKKT